MDKLEAVAYASLVMKKRGYDPLKIEEVETDMLILMDRLTPDEAINRWRLGRDVEGIEY